MNLVMITIIILIPFFAAVLMAISFVANQKKEERDEKEYMSTLSEEEKREYILQKNKDIQSQQSYYRMNDIVSGKKQ